MPSRQKAKTETVDVVFTLPRDVRADNVVLCGEFNDWSCESIVLERADDGSWRAIVGLEPGRSYRYRYLIDGEHWENAWQADGYLPNPYGSEDSVIVVA
jgi:1,4-alpha-glucan branching enzyme